MHRFFIAPDLFASDTPALPAQVARQINTVLRLRPGERVLLLDGQGSEADLELTEVSHAAVAGRVLAWRPCVREPRTRVVLCQALLTADKFEWVLKKGTELGISAFVPLLTRRAMAGLEDVSQARLTRWRTILREAAEQCGRGLIPTLGQVQPLMHTLASLPSNGLALLPWEEAEGPSLSAALRAAVGEAPAASEQPITLLIGPRDGCLAEEVQLAQRHGVQPVTLGPRTLRAETAALAAATLTLAACGELGELAAHAKKSV
jgi:16S rRNA (uracil1498-N3)-methyltransferase